MAAVAVAGPAAAQHIHEAGPLLQVATPAKPLPLVFFSPADLELLKSFVDIIIPRTDTPGASDAGVPGIIDRSLRNSERAKEQWRDSLAWVKSEMQKPDATPASLVQAGNEDAANHKSSQAAAFFVLLKGATIDAYYATREGLQTELGWNANTYLTEFKGCTHPEHQV